MTMAHRTRLPISSLASLALGLPALFALHAALSAQEADHEHGHTARQDSAEAGTQPSMAERVVMPTADAKAFRRARAAVAAVQAKLALEGAFDGRVNGLYGPSTRRAIASRLAAEGRPAAEFPGVENWLALPGFDPSLAEQHVARLRLPGAGEVPSGERMAAAEGGMDHADMAGHAMAQSVEGEAEDASGAPATVKDDPQPPKALVLMEMGRMASRNVHARAVRSTRALVGTFQLWLAEEGLWTDAVDGLPGTPAMREALRAYQERQWLEPSGELDFSTALALLGVDRSRVDAELGSRVELDHSPVAHDRELMHRYRYPSLIGGPGEGGDVGGDREDRP